MNILHSSKALLIKSTIPAICESDPFVEPPPKNLVVNQIILNITLCSKAVTTALEIV
jgi:hypothetical protein